MIQPSGLVSILHFTSSRLSDDVSLDNGQPADCNPMNESQNTPFGPDFNRGLPPIRFTAAPGGSSVGAITAACQRFEAANGSVRQSTTSF
jgi:hypothetical protein